MCLEKGVRSILLFVISCLQIKANSSCILNLSVYNMVTLFLKILKHMHLLNKTVICVNSCLQNKQSSSKMVLYHMGRYFKKDSFHDEYII